MKSLPALKGEGPLYEQIADAVAEMIASGELKPGDAIPSQNELMSIYGVSQATVRQAVLNLGNRGLVLPRHGAGVFVLEPRVEADLLLPLARVDADQLRYELCLSEEIDPPSRVMAMLALEPGTRTMRHRRKVFLGDRLLGLETITYRAEHDSTEIVERSVQGGFWTFVEAGAAASIASVDVTITASVLSEFDASLLSIRPGASTLQRSLVLCTIDHSPVVMTRMAFLGDQVQLSQSIPFHLPKTLSR